jgi:hypothetical protein
MARIPRPSGSRPLAALALVLSVGVAARVAGPPLRDAPVVWHEDDRRDISQPATRVVNRTRAGVEAALFRPTGRFFDPARFVRWIAGGFTRNATPLAHNVNAVDEVPNSSWFTNRIGLFPLTPADAARGLVADGAPAPDGVWTVSSKTEGVTPGFTIRDARGHRFLLKFDPPGFPETSTAAGVITGRILHAAGYNVPADMIVTVRREQLVVGERVPYDPPEGERRAMTEADLDAILAGVEPTADGNWRALASRFLDGTPVGPFDWRGRRKDDANDRIDHEHRRELRAFRMFAAWLCHYDTKQGNSLDMYVEEDGRRFVRHHFIDFASTLGAGALGPIPTACHEYSFDVALVLGRTLALGLWEDPWRRVTRPPDLTAIGSFQSDEFHPMAFRPFEPNAAFANFTDRDGYWAAKVISAFTDEHLRAAVAEGRYTNPAAAEWIAQVLAERRDIIARYFFDRLPPLDFFGVNAGRLQFRDLGAERGLYDPSSTRYRVRIATVSAGGDEGPWGTWVEIEIPTVDLEALPHDRRSDDAGRASFVAVEFQVSRAESGWSRSVRAYIAQASERVVAVDR